MLTQTERSLTCADEELSCRFPRLTRQQIQAGQYGRLDQQPTALHQTLLLPQAYASDVWGNGGLKREYTYIQIAHRITKHVLNIGACPGSWLVQLHKLLPNAPALTSINRKPSLSTERFSNTNVHMTHLGILHQCRIGLGGPQMSKIERRKANGKVSGFKKNKTGTCPKEKTKGLVERKISKPSK